MFLRCILSVLTVPSLVLAGYAGSGLHTTNPQELDEPTIVIEFAWEAEADLIFIYGASHESTGDPLVNPWGGPSASYGGGCMPDAVVSDEILPVVLTTDTDFELGYPAWEWTPGTYRIVAFSNAWCAYYIPGAEPRAVDIDDANAREARYPAGSEIAVTATVTYYNIPGAETQTFTGMVPVAVDAMDPGNRRVLGTVVLPDPSGSGSQAADGGGRHGGGQ